MTTRVRLFTFSFLILAVAGGACDGSDEPTETTSPQTSAPTTTTEPPLDMQAHAESLVVGIASEGDFLALGATGDTAIGEGTGVVIATDGLILTAATGVIGADRINVFVPGEEFPLVGELDAAAECVNLALVRVAHSFDAAVPLVAATDPVAVAVADRQTIVSGPTEAIAFGQSFALSGGPDPGAGAVLFDADGDFAGMVTGFGSGGRPIALDGAEAGSWARQMRQRQTVQQLGFTLASDADGQAVVAAVADTGPGAAMDLGVGDVITSVDGIDLIGGLDQLCKLIEDGDAPLEVIKDGRRHVGSFPDGSLILASARTTEQIRQAVVEVGVPGEGTGTGFFVSEDGLVVTNYHVAGGADEVSLRIDGIDETIPARVIGGSGCADIAVLRATGGPFEFLEWAPDAPVLEEPIRVVGFPNSTDTISFQDGAVAKEVSDGADWGGFLTNFETSAKIDGGNSGGPVVNSLGEVLGVTYAISPGHISGIYNPRHLMGTEARAVVDKIIAELLIDPGFQSTVERPYRSLDGLVGYTVEVHKFGAMGPGAVLGLEPLDEIVVFGDVLPQQDGTGFRKICESVADNGGTAPIDVVIWRWTDERLWDGQLYGAPLTRRPDPYRLATEDGSISALVPGRWIDHEEIEADDADWLGYWAAEDLRGPGSYFDEFGRGPGMRLMWSRERAITHTTESHLEGLSYARSADGSARAFADFGFVGHYQRFDFSGAAAVEYALTVAGDPDSPLIMLFVADEGHRIDETVSRILDSLRLEIPPAGGNPPDS